ncbi:hypothetical protein Scep_002556 [Stephania cephalantha]|uniref:Uncharacterized protein n=1 Tax=Stephania cephalantha TaxID=152367 RepID=A0AAP0Q4R1_9MAGN
MATGQRRKSERIRAAARAARENEGNDARTPASQRNSWRARSWQRQLQPKWQRRRRQHLRHAMATAAIYGGIAIDAGSAAATAREHTRWRCRTDRMCESTNVDDAMEVESMARETPLPSPP